MLRTYEAVVEQDGSLRLLEQIPLQATQRVLVTVLDEQSTMTSRPFGLAAGEFIVPDDFDDPLPDEILRLFEDV